MLARLAKLPPDSDERWAYEVKWDGVRALAYIDAGDAHLESRTLEVITPRYPELAGLSEALTGHRCVLDGEIVALDADGRPSFQLLQRRMGLSNAAMVERRVKETAVTYMVFDVLYLDGADTMALPYAERRELLAGLPLDGRCWHAPAHHVGEGAALLETTHRQKLEGIVGKRLDSLYRPGKRTGEWIKVRNRPRQEFVIGGWSPGEGRRSGSIGSLLVGYNDLPADEAKQRGEPQRLLFAGGVGTGFTAAELKRLEDLLKPLRRKESPFEPPVPIPRRRNAVFCEPRYVCDVEFSEWTHQGTLRQPSYKGLRDDKVPRDVVRESP
jgi:bifunctional non-homologous end joining protein LigD